MRIALINENSQAGKNEIIYRELKGVVEPMGHVVDNYGMLFRQMTRHSLPMCSAVFWLPCFFLQELQIL